MEMIKSTFSAVLIASSLVFASGAQATEVELNGGGSPGHPAATSQAEAALAGPGIPTAKWNGAIEPTGGGKPDIDRQQVELNGGGSPGHPAATSQTEVALAGPGIPTAESNAEVEPTGGGTPRTESHT
ncbi:hypothetical protein NSQ26_10035 [Bacillus sp. FSL W7-1360]